MSRKTKIGPDAFGRMVAIGFAGTMLAACADKPTWPGSVYYQPETAFCYVTLANIDCFANPQPGQDYRWVGYSVITPD